MWYALDPLPAPSTLLDVDVRPNAFCSADNRNNFVKMAVWSPDGSALLSLADDNKAVVRCHDLLLREAEVGS